MDKKIKVVAIDMPLVNEYGTGYGTQWLLFSETMEEANTWIKDNLEPDGIPHWTNRGLYDQVRVQVITVDESRGSPWWLLLEMFAKKEVGPSTLKRIARLSQWWPPE
ncbi:MAG: hypothetical protein UY48_C0001G0001 [Candidatus Gottesmanbacteria bacterium GW2011_GWB1_49_7]|uniref:Uncharacterized protein n=1 Tax=Candidatus Gottesmanbacteria bacterium GW2011_GWB1_49_7 TaxID=1618448 RepID=A0A0G1W451_9BACT|nr:MAG: hypothetical protein UY48_C0001G0001 [Candidatus Gottesmanbacteria bacterium GW2011_GWB1_49_7]